MRLFPAPAWCAAPSRGQARVPASATGHGPSALASPHAFHRRRVGPHLQGRFRQAIRALSALQTVFEAVTPPCSIRELVAVPRVAPPRDGASPACAPGRSCRGTDEAISLKCWIRLLVLDALLVRIAMSWRPAVDRGVFPIDLALAAAVPVPFKPAAHGLQPQPADHPSSLMPVPAASNGAKPPSPAPSALSAPRLRLR